jgi:hypothetical protein
MSQETKKVLEMLASGQINTDDAEKLLEKLGASGSASAPSPASEQTPAPEDKSGAAAMGADLHDRINDVKQAVRSKPTRVWGWTIPAREESAKGEPKLRFLRVVVDSPDRDQVNVRVPLAFLRAGMKLFGVIPPHVSAKLAEQGIDLAALRDLKGGELVDELKDLHVDVDSKNGEKVRIYCE